MSDTKTKKPIYKKWWVWVLGVFLLIAIANSGDSDSSSDNNAETSGGSRTETETVYTLKQEVPTGDLTFMANGVSKKKTVGNTYFSKTSQTGTYAIVTVAVQNTGKDTVTINSSLFKMVDAEGREFTYSIEGQSAHTLSGQDDFFLKQVQPGLAVVGDIVFEIPSDATGLKLHVKPGVFSSKEAVIGLE